jgi:hypothetical protein
MASVGCSLLTLLGGPPADQSHQRFVPARTLSYPRNPRRQSPPRPPRRFRRRRPRRLRHEGTGRPSRFRSKPEPGASRAGNRRPVHYPAWSSSPCPCRPGLRQPRLHTAARLRNYAPYQKQQAPSPAALGSSRRMTSPNISRPARNGDSPERRHVASLARSHRVSRQHAGVPDWRV